MRPSSSTTAAFVPMVPRSQPTKTGIRSVPVARISHDARAILTPHDRHWEPLLLDGSVVVAGVSHVSSEEHQWLLSHVHAPMGPTSGDVADRSAADRFDGMS